MTSLRIPLALAVGIVAVMTIKPGYGLALLVMSGALVAGRLLRPRRDSATDPVRRAQRDPSIALEEGRT